MTTILLSEEQILNILLKQFDGRVGIIVGGFAYDISPFMFFGISGAVVRRVQPENILL